MSDRLLTIISTLRPVSAGEAREIRSQLGLSQAELAAVFDLTPANGDRAIRRWEKEGPPMAAGLALLWLRDRYVRKGGLK